MNRELRIGQKVAFSYGYTTEVYTGTITGFTKKMVLIYDQWEMDIRKSPKRLLIIKG